MRSVSEYLIMKRPAAVMIVLLLIFSGSAGMLSGCAATTKTESTGQYIDDSAITAKVKQNIFKEPDLKVSQIGVETYKGVVQLSGFVNSQDEIKKAGDIAASVPGVVSVKNDLIVKAG